MDSHLEVEAQANNPDECEAEDLLGCIPGSSKLRPAHQAVSTVEKEFPYDGIFSPGGFLSRTEADSDQGQSQNQVQDVYHNQEKQEVMFPVISDNNACSVTHADSQTEQCNLSKTKVQRLNKILPPNEAIVSINLVLEKIFSFLGVSELLACRLVSRHFHSLAQKPLESLVTFTFSKINPESTPIDSWNSNSSEKKSKSLSSFTQELQSGSISWRVVKCSFIGIPLGNSVLQEFLSNNGKNIEHLSLRDRGGDEYENQLNDHLTNLLLVQTPNLQSLKINFGRFRFTPYFEGVLYGNVFLGIVPQLQNLHAIGNNEPHPLNNSLKLLKMQGFLNPIIFRTIISLCPSLQEVNVDENERSLLNLLNQQNRIDLIKSMEFKPSYVTCEEFENMFRSLSTDSNLTLKLRRINFPYVNFLLKKCQWPDVLKERTVKMFNLILKSSWDSLESIKFDGKGFPKGIEWPQIMPRLKHLSLEVEFYHESRPHTSLLSESGLNWLKKFPRLESLELFLPKCTTDFKDFFEWLCVEGILPKVKVVRLIGVKSEERFTNVCSTLRASFPNARFRL